MTDREAFFRLRAGLPRQGPGEPEDVAWAARLCGLAPDARICDAGCGPGADIPALLDAAPQGHITAIDKYFAPEAERWSGPQVTVAAGDMAAPGGPFDLIWSAGALYFLGVTEGLRGWRAALAPGGAVAFSHPCLFQDSPGARAFWGAFPVQPEPQCHREVQAAGFEVLGTRWLSDAAWEAYYAPLEARLTTASGPEAQRARAEIDGWRQWRRHTGYLLMVVR